MKRLPLPAPSAPEPPAVNETALALISVAEVMRNAIESARQIPITREDPPKWEKLHVKIIRNPKTGDMSDLVISRMDN